MNRTLLTAALALAPLVGFAAPVTYTPGDLLVGFRVITGQGAGQAYLVDVGPAATLRDATSSTVVAHIGTDLTTTYGAGWLSRIDLQWGAACSPSNASAVNGDAIYTSYVSAPEDSPGVPGDPWVIQASSTFRGLSTTLFGLQSEFQNNGVPTAANPAATFQDAASPVSWRAYMDGGQKGASGDLNIFSEIEAVPAKTLSIFRISTDLTGTYQGHLSLNSSGDITFTPAPPDGGNTNTYVSWAQTNVGGQGPALDYDGDGISNGLEYFMGTPPGAPTAHAVPAGGSISWPRSATAVVTAFRVEISTDLVTWTDATSSGAVAATSTDITYTLPVGTSKTFVRLSVDVPES